MAEGGCWNYLVTNGGDTKAGIQEAKDRSDHPCSTLHVEPEVKSRPAVGAKRPKTEESKD